MANTTQTKLNAIQALNELTRRLNAIQFENDDLGASYGRHQCCIVTFQLVSEIADGIFARMLDPANSFESIEQEETEQPDDSATIEEMNDSDEQAGIILNQLYLIP